MAQPTCRRLHFNPNAIKSVPFCMTGPHKGFNQSDWELWTSACKATLFKSTGLVLRVQKQPGRDSHPVNGDKMTITFLHSQPRKDFHTVYGKCLEYGKGQWAVLQRSVTHRCTLHMWLTLRPCVLLVKPCLPNFELGRAKAQSTDDVSVSGDSLKEGKQQYTYKWSLQ